MIRSLYSATLGQAIPSAIGRYLSTATSDEWKKKKEDVLRLFNDIDEYLRIRDLHSLSNKKTYYCLAHDTEVPVTFIARVYKLGELHDAIELLLSFCVYVYANQKYPNVINQPRFSNPAALEYLVFKRDDVNFNKTRKSQGFEQTSSKVIQDPLEWDELDGQTTSTYRKEQLWLRQFLLQGRAEAPCVICGHTFPADLLWAAHLKKRSLCSDDEKEDHHNIAKLMCKLGCDDLYEKGYIGVLDGRVRVIRDSPLGILSEKLSALEGQPCLEWNDQTDDYFQWHYSFFGGM